MPSGWSFDDIPDDFDWDNDLLVACMVLLEAAAAVVPDATLCLNELALQSNTIKDISPIFVSHSLSRMVQLGFESLTNDRGRIPTYFMREVYALSIARLYPVTVVIVGDEQVDPIHISIRVEANWDRFFSYSDDALEVYINDTLNGSMDLDIPEKVGEHRVSGLSNAIPETEACFGSSQIVKVHGLSAPGAMLFEEAISKYPLVTRAILACHTRHYRVRS